MLLIAGCLYIPASASSDDDEEAGGDARWDSDIGTEADADTDAGSDTSTEPEDSRAPAIEHEPVTSAKFGTDIPIVATITDSSAVDRALVWFRNETDVDWSSAGLSGDGDAFEGDIPAHEQRSAGMFYYLDAADIHGNGATSPVEGEGSPYLVRLEE